MTHKQFSKTLATWRAWNNYTQRTAAEMLGVSKRSLENWEQQRAMPQGFGLKAMLKLIAGPPKAAVKRPRKRVARKRG